MNLEERIARREERKEKAINEFVTHVQEARDIAMRLTDYFLNHMDYNVDGTDLPDTSFAAYVKESLKEIADLCFKEGEYAQN